jgi:hypothetical protein
MRLTSSAGTLPCSPRIRSVGTVRLCHSGQRAVAATPAIAAFITSGSKRGRSPSGPRSKSAIQASVMARFPRKTRASSSSANGTGHEAKKARSFSG